jgi:hypothetical protein
MSNGYAESFIMEGKEVKPLTNGQLEAMTQIVNNGDIFEQNKVLFLSATIKEISVSLNLDKAQLKEIDTKYIPLEKTYKINEKRMEILKKKLNKQYSEDTELEILNVESKNVEIENSYLSLKEIRDELFQEIQKKEKELTEFKLKLNNSLKKKGE